MNGNTRVVGEVLKAINDVTPSRFWGIVILLVVLVVAWRLPEILTVVWK